MRGLGVAISVGLWVGLGACGGGAGGAARPKPGPVTTKPIEARELDAGLVLITHERDVWTLEGLLLAEAEAAMRSPAARQALGDPARIRRGMAVEPAARAFLRASRSREARRLGGVVVAGLDDASRAALARAAAAAGPGISDEDVFLDYLTYEGLYDLALLRYGFARWKAGRLTGPAQEIAANFFGGDRAREDAPRAAQGIAVRVADARRLELDVFGARVAASIEKVEGGVVTWTSGYERLRAGLRGRPDAPTRSETLVLGGTYRVAYTEELAEYLTHGAVTPWATMLYLLPADEVADLYAGVAAGAGLEGGSALAGRDLAALPAAGSLGPAERGVSARVVEARRHVKLGDVPARHGGFLAVRVELKSTLATDLRMPAAWFNLTTSGAEYPELSVAHPDTALALLPAAPPGTLMLELPFTTLPAGATRSYLLVFDVPADAGAAALVLGDDELALAVPAP